MRLLSRAKLSSLRHPRAGGDPGCRAPQSPGRAAALSGDLQLKPTKWGHGPDLVRLSLTRSSVSAAVAGPCMMFLGHGAQGRASTTVWDACADCTAGVSGFLALGHKENKIPTASPSGAVPSLPRTHHVSDHVPLKARRAVARTDTPRGLPGDP